ncbi:hypothetical protein EAF04_010565 [Stromatinia cepivora]|nr:hypothetical protein EAF04_010565 [Stromatinia cepivora]
MHPLTIVAAIAVLSNIVSAIPQPGGKIEQIQQKRWGWPWSTVSDSGNGKYGNGHGKGGKGWGDNGNDDDGDDDDSFVETKSLLPFTHPHLVAEATPTSTRIGTEISTSGDSSLSATSLLLNSTSTSTSKPTISATLKPTLSPPLIQNHTSLTLCPANPTSIITITENCTSTHWITISAGAEWSSTSLVPTSSMSLSTVTSLPSLVSGVPSAGANLTGIWTTTSLREVTSRSAATSLRSSISGAPSGAPSGGFVSVGGNSTGVWTTTPLREVTSRGWSTGVGGYSSSSGTATGYTSTFVANSTLRFLSSFIPSTLSASLSASISTSATSNKDLTSTTVLLSTTTLPYPYPSSSSSTLSSTILSLTPSTSNTTSPSTIPSIPATPTPIATGTTSLHPSTTIQFTTTVTTIQISGTPNPAAVHCGLHGLPVGDYFLAEFVEDKAGVAVSLRGCWEFCYGVYGIDKGCVSYSFYPEPGTGAPRCDLFGGSVAQSLDSIIPQVPNVWFDLECGDPTLLLG